MKAYRITVMVLDFERYGPEDYMKMIDNIDHCYTIKADQIDIGEWDDNHLLNRRGTDVNAYFDEKLKEQLG